MVVMEITVTMAIERVIKISQYKAAAMSYLNSQYLSYFEAYKAKICLFTQQSVLSVVARETLVAIATRQVIDISAI